MTLKTLYSLGGTLHCNDSSQSRITRLKDVLTLHFPAHVARQVTVTKKDGTELLSPRYSKVRQLDLVRRKDIYLHFIWVFFM